MTISQIDTHTSTAFIPVCRSCGNCAVFSVHMPHKILSVGSEEIAQMGFLGHVTCGRCGAAYSMSLDSEPASPSFGRLHRDKSKGAL